MMVALEPVRRKNGLWTVSSCQLTAVSGAGMGAYSETQRELKEVLNDGVDPRDAKAEILPAGGDKSYPIAFNALPQIDALRKMTILTKKWRQTKLRKSWKTIALPYQQLVCASPVLSAHSESVYIETKEVAPLTKWKAAIAEFLGAVLEDDVAHQIYPSR